MPQLAAAGRGRSSGDHGGVVPQRFAAFALLDELRLRGWERVLFIGCGDGWVAEEAWRRMMAKGYVCGVDRSPTLVARASRIRGVPGKLEFKTWNGLSLPYPDRCFDAVASQGDVRCWPEPVSVLREMRRLVRRRGEICLVEGPGRPGAEAGSSHGEWPGLLEPAGLVLVGAGISSAGVEHAALPDDRTARVLHARPGD